MSGPRIFVVFGVVAVALFMQSLDATIVATALNAIKADLGTSINWVAWAITVYSFGLIVFLPLAANLCSLFSYKAVFLISVTTFGIVSLCCGFAPNIYLLIVLRFLQSAGGAGFSPAATGIVVSCFGSQRDRAISLFGTVHQIGGITGPIIGGLFVAGLSWRWIFFVNLPVCGVLLLVGAVVIQPTFGDRRRRSRTIDVRSLVYLATGTSSLLVGFSLLGEGRPMALFLAALFLTACGVSLWRFLRRTRRVSNPIVSPGLLFGRGFSTVNIVNFVYGGATSGVVSLVPLYAATRYDLSALSSGTLLTAQAICASVLSVVGAFTLRSTGYRVPLYVCAIIGTASMIMISVRAPTAIGPYAWLALWTALIGVGNGWANAASRNAGLHLAPSESASIGALRTMARRMGSISGVAIVTMVMALSSSPATAQAYAFGIHGLLLLCAVPVIRHLPEHRGSW